LEGLISPDIESSFFHINPEILTKLFTGNLFYKSIGYSLPNLNPNLTL